MRLRFLNTYEPVTTLYRDLLPYLAECGAQVDVVLSDAAYRDERGDLAAALTGSDTRLVQIRSGSGSINARSGKALVMIDYALGAAMATLFGRRVDVNVFLTQPPLFALWGWVLRVLRGERYLCVAMDIYPDLAIEHGVLRAHGVLSRLLRALSRFTLRRADAVVAIGRHMADRLVRAGVPSRKLHVIPNWANEDKLRPVSRDQSAWARALGLEDAFVVLYSGNMGVGHWFDDVLEVARRTRAMHDLRFVFVGGGARRGEIEEARERDGLDNLLLLPFQPLEQLGESLSLGDVHFISLREGSEGLLAPSKAYGALAVGRPIIYQGSERGEIARMVIEEEVGFVVPQGDPDALERAILTLYRNRALARQQGQRARRLAESKYSWRRACERYAEVLALAVRDAEGGEQPAVAGDRWKHGFLSGSPVGHPVAGGTKPQGAPFKPVVIVGAARSGTNMLRDLLIGLPGFGTWPCDEINYIWRHGNMRERSDEFPSVLATEPVRRSIRYAFARLARKQDLTHVVEKTCANSLRVGFVHRVLPEAKFVYLVRDGRDVVVSAGKRWTAALDLPYILRKARYVPLGDMPYYASRYLWNRVHRLFSSDGELAFWGPKFDGMEEAQRRHSLTEICALQWRRSVDRADAALRDIAPGQVYVLRYEDFVADPATGLEELAVFLGVPISYERAADLTRGVSSASVGRWQLELGAEDAARVQQMLEETLSRHGYN